METKSPQISYTIIDDPLAKGKVERMTDMEINKLCETEKGMMQYITETIERNQGFYNWVYIGNQNATISNTLLEKGILRKRKSPSGVFEFQPTF